MIDDFPASCDRCGIGIRKLDNVRDFDRLDQSGWRMTLCIPCDEDLEAVLQKWSTAVTFISIVERSSCASRSTN